MTASIERNPVLLIFKGYCSLKQKNAWLFTAVWEVHSLYH